jgi:hypothetical protein
MLVFASTKYTGKGNTGRVMFACVVTELMPVRTYLNHPEFQRRFDCTFDTSTVPWTRNENGGPWHRGDHNDNRQKSGLNDYERDQTRETVLLSRRFRDFSRAPVPMPDNLQHLVHKSIGCTKRTGPGDVEAVVKYFNL